MQATIFEPFFTTKSSGTGLGLYIAREICESSQAQLDYLDLADEGSCFRITFPEHSGIIRFSVCLITCNKPMSNPIALIVDDEPDIRELLELTLGRMQIDTRSAADLKQAHELLASEHFDICLTDMRLPDGNGIDLVRHINQQELNLPTAVITAYGSVDTAIEALKAGAFDFISKPVDLNALRKLITSVLKLSEPYPRRERRTRNTLLGESAALRQIRSTIDKLARSQAPIYISGESGTGKELVAKLIHTKGPRADSPFVPVNCGAIPSELMESEFFGHKKGSFTGAIQEKAGLFQVAEGGTLFLDEVAELPLHMQVKLLRAIQEKAVRPVGAAAGNPDGCAHPLGNPQGPRATGDGWPVPAGPVLSPQCHSAGSAAPARAAAKMSRCWSSISCRILARQTEQPGLEIEAEARACPGPLRLPGQCPRTGEYPRARHHPV